MDDPAWNPENLDPGYHANLQVGHQAIDHQHVALSRMVLEVTELLNGGAEASDISDSYRQLLAQYREHFDFEEALMAIHGYPHLARHKEDHNRYLEDGFRLLEEIDRTPDGLASRMYEWWRGWSVVHIVSEDQELGQFLQSRL